MPTYLFSLGREPLLSVAEILSVFRLLAVTITETHPSNRHLILSTRESIDISPLMHRLGGTLKIGSAIPVSGSVDDSIADWLLQQQPESKIEFSIADTKSGLRIKKLLQSRGRSARYIEPKNTATILHNRLVEKQGDFMVIGDHVFVTVAIQPIEEFGEREFGRPGSDARSGMLPLKLAKILINLAEVTSDQTLLDPFCGSGTIVTEAMEVGYAHIIGSDISPKAVDNTKKNVEWMQKRLETEDTTYATPTIIVSDIKDLQKKIPLESIDAIVTEPYLGKPLTGRESRSFIEKQIQELSTLYIDAFRSFHALMKTGGRVMIVLPAFKTDSGWCSIDIISEIKKIGFLPVPFDERSSFLRHMREGQRVARDVWRFKKM